MYKWLPFSNYLGDAFAVLKYPGLVKKPLTLSKSRIVDGILCDKKVHLAIHNPELKAKVTPDKQQVFDQGNEVGAIARNKYPGGKLIEVDYRDTNKAVHETKNAIEAGHNTIYEATFLANSLLCKVDILHRETSNNAWHIIEVKSGVSGKPEYLVDAAIQAHILNEAKVKWDKVSLMYLNNECRYPDLSNLLIELDVTARVADIIDDLPEQIKAIVNIVMSKERPTKEIGRYCEEPYLCDFKKTCWAHVPDYSVFDIPLGWKLFDRGYLSIESIDPSRLTPSQRIPYEVTVSGKRKIDVKKLKKDLKSWDLPFYHLDFETIGPAIPRYESTGPFAKVPFQFSLDIQKDYTKDIKHFEYLQLDDSDPRRPLAEKLVEYIPKSGGTVLAFNSSFESQVLKKLADQFPDLADHLLSIESRLVDPQKTIKSHVYDKAFRGSFSLKDVAPALLGEHISYENLKVYDGKAAQRAFDEMIQSNTTAERKESLRKHLLKYCAQDTVAMVELVCWMNDQ